MSDDMMARIATCLANCSQGDMSFVQSCKRFYESYGKLTTPQTSALNGIYFRIRRRLEAEGVMKKGSWR